MSADLDGRVHNQILLAERLVDEWSSDGFDVDVLDLLDYLAIVGVRLEPLQQDDFDPADGVSIASRAYFDLVTGRRKTLAQQVAE